VLKVAKKECEAFFGIGRWANSFLYNRKLRHSVESRQERMRSILWNWPLGQFFFMRRGAQMKLLLAQRAPRTRRVGGKSSLLNSGFESQQSCDMGDGLIIVRTWLHVSAGLSELLLNLLQSCTVNIRKE